MILFSHGNVLDAPEDIIVHQVNCQGKMNSGVAKQIREKWPVAYTEYMRTWSNAKDKSGLLGFVRIVDVEPSKYVANLFGQDYYGYDGQRYTSYDALYEGLAYIKDMAKMYSKSIAMPFMMGCDRGGANWRIVNMMIEEIFADYKVHLYKLEEN